MLLIALNMSLRNSVGRWAGSVCRSSNCGILLVSCPTLLFTMTACQEPPHPTRSG